ncbi:PfkB family carbohydrate kinase [Bengtsoniella intestinalis]|uniref:PfkB family carbohydrate kinase n=1 Tax=Bengtsoniella intestinalis TaxID=3073143 RepID=UPI00391FC835
MEHTHIIDQLNTTKGSALLGIDGMVDEVWELIASRTDQSTFTKMARMMDFGDVINQRKTGGMAIERVLKRRISGGFVCNTGRAVAKLGQETTLLGLFGTPTIEPIFHEFDQLASLVSLGPSVNMHLLEFADGKIMMPNLQNLFSLQWKTVVDTLGQETVDQLLNVDVVGIGYWSNMYDFEAVLQGVVTSCVGNGKTKRIFHDFANLNKRTREALTLALETLQTQDKILPQTLSLNEHEGGILAGEYDLPYPADVNHVETWQQVFETVCALRERIDIDELIVHTSHYAVIATATQGAWVSFQKFCQSPVKTTGAGDTFNGGYMVASMMNLSPQERLLMANATTHCYVSTGEAPPPPP